MTSSPTPVAPAPATITPVPGPWTLKGTIYTFMTYTSSKGARALEENKSWLYAPLELGSSFASGKMVGGLGMVQVIRYTESPVGPYDEIVVVPGAFEREQVVAGKNGEKKTVKKSNLKCTRIYVSQERTCWNGRKSEFSRVHLGNQFEGVFNGLLTIPRLEHPQAPRGLQVHHAF